MTNYVSALHLLLSQTSQEYRRGLHEIIGAPPGDSPSLLCGHLSLLRTNAGGHALDQTTYKQLVTDIADKVGFEWASIVGPTPWSALSSEQIEAGIVRQVEADKMYREEAPSEPDVIAALDDAFSSLSGDWRKLLAAVIYIHQVIRPAANPVETRSEPAAEPATASPQHSSGNGAESAALNDDSLPSLQKSGDKAFRSGSETLGPSLLDFWRWSASDLAGDAMRPALAAYIVSCALGIQNGSRTGGEAAGLLLHPGGLKIEVTSASNPQIDPDQELADVRFPIRGNRAGENGAGVLAVNLKRRADLYVFCLLAPRDGEALDPLDVSQWEFYVVPSSELDAQFPLGTSIRLESLPELGIAAVKYEQLSATIAGFSSPAAKRAAAPGWQASPARESSRL